MLGTRVTRKRIDEGAGGGGAGRSVVETKYGVIHIIIYSKVWNRTHTTYDIYNKVRTRTYDIYNKVRTRHIQHTIYTVKRKTRHIQHMIYATKCETRHIQHMIYTN